MFKEVSVDRAALEALESSPEFQAVAVKSLGSAERAMGESVIAAQPPNWKEVGRLAKASGIFGPKRLATAFE